MKSFSEYLNESLTDWVKVKPGESFSSNYDNFLYAKKIIRDTDPELLKDLDNNTNDTSKEYEDIRKALGVLHHAAGIGKLSSEARARKEKNGFKADAPKAAIELLATTGIKPDESGKIIPKKDSNLEKGINAVKKLSKGGDEKPTDEKPADEKPADEKPTDEKPTDEKPTDDKPSEGDKKDTPPTNGEKDTPPKASEASTDKIGDIASTAKEEIQGAIDAHKQKYKDYRDEGKNNRAKKVGDAQKKLEQSSKKLVGKIEGQQAVYNSGGNGKIYAMRDANKLKAEISSVSDAAKRNLDIISDRTGIEKVKKAGSELKSELGAAKKRISNSETVAKMRRVVGKTKNVASNIAKTSTAQALGAKTKEVSSKVMNKVKDAATKVDKNVAGVIKDGKESNVAKKISSIGTNVNNKTIDAQRAIKDKAGAVKSNVKGVVSKGLGAMKARVDGTKPIDNSIKAKQARQKVFLKNKKKKTKEEPIDVNFG